MADRLPRTPKAAVAEAAERTSPVKPKRKPAAIEKAVAPGDALEAEASRLAMAAEIAPPQAKRATIAAQPDHDEHEKESTMTDTKTEAKAAADRAQAETAKTAATVRARMEEQASDMQDRMQGAYRKAADLSQEAASLQQGHVEALAESSRIMATGLQDMGREALEAGKAAMETVNDDMRRVAAIKSPTELFQLQGEIARRNFDAMVRLTSKNVERSMKLANDSFAPLSTRMSVAAEKVAKAA